MSQESLLRDWRGKCAAECFNMVWLSSLRTKRAEQGFLHPSLPALQLSTLLNIKNGHTHTHTHKHTDAGTHTHARTRTHPHPHTQSLTLTYKGTKSQRSVKKKQKNFIKCFPQNVDYITRGCYYYCLYIIIIVITNYTSCVARA